MSQNFTYQDYQKNIKLFLYTPDNKLLGQLDAFNISMSLSLKNFSMLEFELPARFFDYETNSMIFNHQIVKTLDMYQVEVEVGDLSPGSNGYETRRFVITERPVSIKGSKASYSYKAFSLEHELKSIPIVNWPGVEVKAYRKQFDTITATSDIQNTLNILPANAAIDQIFVYRKFISEGGIRDVEEFLDRVEIGGSPTNSEIYAQLSESQYYINLSPKITTQTTTINQNFTINQFIERYQPWIGNFFALANEKSFNVNFPTGGESIFAVNSLSVSLAAGTLPSPNNIRFSLSFFNKGNLVLRSPSYTYAEISSAINLSVKAAVDKIIIKVSDYGSTIPNLYTLLINSINFSTSDVPKIYWKIPQNQRIQGKNNQIVANGHPDSYYEIDEHALVVYHPFSNDIVPAPEENEPKYTEDFYYLTDGITFEQVINDIYTKQNKDFFQWIIDANSFDPSIKEEVRSGLSVNNTNWYDFLKKLGEDFDIHIDYDTQNRRINFIHNDSFGEDINLVYEYGKYNNGVTQDYITTNMYNYVQGYDGSNVGFGVESFSGDNYYEDYTYLLEGAQWNPLTQNITKSSRFLSDDLTKVLAKKKHMIEQYEEEVFGNNFARVGLLQTRTERLKKEWPIQFEIAEIENKLINFKNLLDSYNKKSAQEKNLLRTWTKAMSIPLNQGFSKKEVFFPATAESVFKFSPTDIQKEVEYVLDFPTEGPSQITDINTFIFTFANDWKISFKADNTKRGIPVRSPIISYQPDTISLKLELYDSNGVPIHTETIRNKYYNTVRGVGNSTNYQAAFKPFLDNDTVITKLVLTVTARKDHTFNYYLDPELKSIENRLQPVSIVFYPGNNTTEGKEFIGYEPYLKYMIQYTENELLVKQTLLDTMKQARPQNYTIDQPFTEAFENIAGQFGSSTLSNRLEYIQGVTSWRDADFTGYSTSMANLKSELKTIRRGAVYQNKDIFDGGMLLKAAKQFLEDNRYPEITISIDTISILDSSELKSKWSNLKIGDYIYIYINELELFIKAQIQDLKYNFETYKLGMTITNRNEYTPGVLGKLGKMFMKVKDESQNILITGKNTNSKPTPPRRGAPLGSNFGGVLINTEGQVETPEPEQASQNSSESVQTSTHPMTNQEQGYPAPHLEGTVITQGYMNVTPGALVVTNNNRETIITISAGEGIVAEKFKIDLEGNATFAGNLQAAGGTFSGDLSAAGGTFSGDLSAAGGTFAGNLQAAGGTFSGNLSAAGGTFSGDLQASDGSFGSITVEPTGSITVGNIVISNSGIIATNGVTPNPTQTFNLNATNGDLTITGGLSAASAVQFSDVNVSINQHTYGYEQPGIFLGVIEQDGLKERFSIVGPGINPNYLKWTGDALDLQGDLGGTIGKISVEGEEGLIEITEDGVFGYEDKENKSVSSFALTKEGELTLTGTITATAGDIGGWKIQENENGSPGIYSGNTFLADNTFGSSGQVTISSEGYIAGNKFKINKAGEARFTDLEVSNILSTIYRSNLSSASSTLTTSVNRLRSSLSPVTFLTRTISSTPRYIDVIKGQGVPPHLAMSYIYSGDSTTHYFKGTYGYLEALIYNGANLVKTVQIGLDGPTNQLGQYSYNEPSATPSGQIIIGESTFNQTVPTQLFEIPVYTMMTNIQMRWVYTSGALGSLNYQNYYPGEFAEEPATKSSETLTGSFQFLTFDAPDSKLTGLKIPTVDGDAVPLYYLKQYHYLKETTLTTSTLAPSSTRYTISGGTLPSLKKTEMFFGDKKFVTYSGTGNITNQLATVTITIVSTAALNALSVIAVSSNNSSSYNTSAGGSDTIYVYKPNNYTFVLYHDFANGSFYRDFEILITGWEDV